MFQGCPKMNEHGGIYQLGRSYELDKKVCVTITYRQLLALRGQGKVTISAVAKKSKVSRKYASKVVEEYKEMSKLEDPRDTHKQAMRRRREVCLQLPPEEEIFLLTLRARKPTRPNIDYIHQLRQEFGRRVSSTFISRWFKERFDHSGRFKKANLVPLDKWKPTNIAKYFEYRILMDVLPLHHMWNFADEKHLVNKDSIAKMARADPLTGMMDCIPVSGDFRESYNLIALVSANPDKEKNIAYHIDTDNGDSVTFFLFMCQLVQEGFFRHDEILVMDNAPIHTGGVAKNLQDILWSTVVNGRPLRMLVIFLPTRSPELNPIELVFNILAQVFPL